MSKTKERESKQRLIENTASAEDPSSTEAQGAKEYAPARERVAECAYFIWLATGKPLAQDVDHWCEAEAKLRGQVGDVCMIRD